MKATGKRQRVSKQAVVFLLDGKIGYRCHMYSKYLLRGYFLLEIANFIIEMIM